MQELLVIFEVKKMNTLSVIGFIRNIREEIHDSYVMILSHLLSLRAMRIEFRNIIARVKRRCESEFLKV